MHHRCIAICVCHSCISLGLPRLLRVLSRSGYAVLSTDGSHSRDFVTWMQFIGPNSTCRRSRCKASSSSSSRQQRLPFRRRRQSLLSRFRIFIYLYAQEDFCIFLCLAWLDTWKAEDAMMLGPESCELLTLGLLGLIRLIPVH